MTTLQSTIQTRTLAERRRLVPCTRCGAEVEEKCRREGGDGHYKTYVHAVRRRRLNESMATYHRDLERGAI